jgi:hypothetical protein
LGENSPFCYFYKKKSQAKWSREFSGKFPKKWSHFEGGKKVMKIVKIFGGFGQILLLKSPYLVNKF